MRKMAVVMVVSLALLVLAGCEQDDGATVTELEAGDTGTGSGSASGTHTGSASGTHTGSASGSASASATVAAACEPVGDAGNADSTQSVVLDEWSVDLDSDFSAGRVSFEIENAGQEAHELVIVRASDAESLPVKDGKVDEEALDEGQFIGEVEAFPAGESCQGTFELEPADYVFFCNIVEEDADGTMRSHFEEGMHTEVSTHGMA